MREGEGDVVVFGEGDFCRQLHFLLEPDGLLGHLFNVVAYRNHSVRRCLKIEVIAVVEIGFRGKLLQRGRKFTI